MAKYETFNTESCYICDEFMGEFKSDLSVVTGYSERPIYELIELMTNTEITEEVVCESGVCQNCFIKFNDYDEHLKMAEQIQADLLSLMNNKLYAHEEEGESGSRVKEELVEDLEEIEESSTHDSTQGSTGDAIEYEPYSAEEVFIQEEGDEDGMAVETIQDDYHFEIVVDDTKENIDSKPSAHKSRVKEEAEFIIIEMDDNSKAYQCDICFKTFKDRSKLRTHREIHTQERNVICPVCMKAFKTMNCLRNHKRLHVPQRTYFNCDQCDKKYTQKVQLKKHIEIVHMQRRDFICNTCGASFGTNSVLKMHQLSHQDFRAEKCEICSYRFHTKAKLRRHMKSHTGERNYECSICFKKFLYSYNVIAHVRNVHEKTKRSTEDPPNFCKYCPETFWKKQQLNDHMVSVHKINDKGEVVITEEEECLYEFEKQD